MRKRKKNISKRSTGKVQDFTEIVSIISLQHFPFDYQKDLNRPLTKKKHALKSNEHLKTRFFLSRASLSILSKRTHVFPSDSQEL